MSIRQPLTVTLPGPLHQALQDGYRIGMLQQPDEMASFLLWLEQQHVLPATVVIEIGANRGGTASIWGAVASDLVLSVDLPNGVGGGLDDDAILMRAALLQQMRPHVQFVLGDSSQPKTIRQVKKLLAGRQADLLFIDGDHTYRGVSADYDGYRKFVRPGGVIAFHDINDTSNAQDWDLGVSRLFEELPEPKYRFTIHADWGGIGAIVV